MEDSTKSKSLPSGFFYGTSPSFFRQYRNGRWGKTKAGSTLLPIPEYGEAASVSVLKKTHLKKTQNGPVVDGDPRIGFNADIPAQTISDGGSQQDASQPLPGQPENPWAVPLSSLKARVTRRVGTGSVEEGKASSASPAP